MTDRIIAFTPITQSDSTRLDGEIVEKKIDVSEALHNLGKTNSAATKPAVVSKEKFTYDGIQGILVKYDDGSAVFVTKKQVNGKEQDYQLRFKNDKDIENKHPSSEIYNAGKENQVISNFEYYNNGNLKNKKVFNAQNKLIREDKHDRDGLIENRRVNDKNGELLQVVKFKNRDKKNHTVQAEVYDKSDKLVSVAYNNYQEDNTTLVSQEIKYPNGVTKSKGECYDNGLFKTKTEYYPSGKLKKETLYWDNGVIKEQKTYDEDGNVIDKISPEIDGNFEFSTQVGEGDCYLMATINSIRELDGGQEMLKNLVKIETNEKGEKVYTVTFPGAKIAADGLNTDERIDPNKMHITGTYTFTEQEIEGILRQAGIRYSIGDGDVILLEAAFEKYRNEVQQTLKENGLTNVSNIAGLQTGLNPNNILYGGTAQDATFILTGRPSSLYSTKPQYALQSEDAHNGIMTVIPMPKDNTLEKTAVSEVDGEISNTQKELDKLLDQIMNDSKDGHTDLIAVASFKLVDKKGKVSGHGLTIKSVTADTVTLVNPWFPKKEITMTRADFMRSVASVTVSDTTKPPVTVNNNGGASGGNDQNPTNPPNNTPVNNGGNDNPNGTPQKNVHSVKRGENLWKIAKKHLGSGATATQIANYVNKIMQANPSLKWDNRHYNVIIHAGDKIVLPKK